MTALIWASGAGHHHVMDSLIQAGASIDHESAVRT
jgi:ankyrin repeat protein